jgi:uncharacterized membrane protein
MATTAKRGRNVISEIYPAAFSPAEVHHEDVVPVQNLGPASRTFEHTGISGVLLAFDAAGLVALAVQCGGVIEIVPRVGDFVAQGEPLFRLYKSDSIDKEKLRRTVAFGPERTLQQDPRLAFRIILDIASKALSPAINDPTTAVLAIDQVHRLLRFVGARKLLTGTQNDVSGNLRLVFPTPSWEDFVWLGIAEFRLYGSDSIRICQRLCAMIGHLIQVLPVERRPPLDLQLRLIKQTIDRRFPDIEDRNRVYAGASAQSGVAADA